MSWDTSPPRAHYFHRTQSPSPPRDYIEISTIDDAGENNYDRSQLSHNSGKSPLDYKGHKNSHISGTSSADDRGVKNSHISGSSSTDVHGVKKRAGFERNESEDVVSDEVKRHRRKLRRDSNVDLLQDSPAGKKIEQARPGESKNVHQHRRNEDRDISVAYHQHDSIINKDNIHSDDYVREPDVRDKTIEKVHFDECDIVDEIKDKFARDREELNHEISRSEVMNKARIRMEDVDMADGPNVIITEAEIYSSGELQEPSDKHEKPLYETEKRIQLNRSPKIMRREQNGKQGYAFEHTQTYDDQADVGDGIFQLGGHQGHQGHSQSRVARAVSMADVARTSHDQGLGTMPTIKMGSFQDLSAIQRAGSSNRVSSLGDTFACERSLSENRSRQLISHTTMHQQFTIEFPVWEDFIILEDGPILKCVTYPDCACVKPQTDSDLELKTSEPVCKTEDWDTVKLLDNSELEANNRTPVYKSNEINGDIVDNVNSDESDSRRQSCFDEEDTYISSSGSKYSLGNDIIDSDVNDDVTVFCEVLGKLSPAELSDILQDGEFIEVENLIENEVEVKIEKLSETDIDIFGESVQDSCTIPVEGINIVPGRYVDFDSECGSEPDVLFIDETVQTLTASDTSLPDSTTDVNTFCKAPFCETVTLISDTVKHFRETDIDVSSFTESVGLSLINKGNADELDGPLFTWLNNENVPEHILDNVDVAVTETSYRNHVCQPPVSDADDIVDTSEGFEVNECDSHDVNKVCDLHVYVADDIDNIFELFQDDVLISDTTDVVKLSQPLVPALDFATIHDIQFSDNTVEQFTKSVEVSTIQAPDEETHHLEPVSNTDDAHQFHVNADESGTTTAGGLVTNKVDIIYVPSVEVDVTEVSYCHPPVSPNTDIGIIHEPITERLDKYLIVDVENIAYSVHGCKDDFIISNIDSISETLTESVDVSVAETTDEDKRSRPFVSSTIDADDICEPNTECVEESGPVTECVHVAVFVTNNINNCSEQRSEIVDITETTDISKPYESSAPYTADADTIDETSTECVDDSVTTNVDIISESLYESVDTSVTETTDVRKLYQPPISSTVNADNIAEQFTECVDVPLTTDVVTISESLDISVTEATDVNKPCQSPIYSTADSDNKVESSTECVDDSVTTNVDIVSEPLSESIDVSVTETTDVSKPFQSPVSSTVDADDIAEPTTTDNIDEPNTTDNIDEPTTTDNIDEPTTTDNIDEPNTTDNIDEPTTTDNIDEPTTTDNIAEPTTTDNIDEPSTECAEYYVTTNVDIISEPLSEHVDVSVTDTTDVSKLYKSSLSYTVVADSIDEQSTDYLDGSITTNVDTIAEPLPESFDVSQYYQPTVLSAADAETIAEQTTEFVDEYVTTNVEPIFEPVTQSVDVTVTDATDEYKLSQSPVTSTVDVDNIAEPTTTDNIHEPNTECADDSVTTNSDIISEPLSESIDLSVAEAAVVNKLYQSLVYSTADSDTPTTECADEFERSEPVPEYTEKLVITSVDTFSEPLSERVDGSLTDAVDGNKVYLLPVSSIVDAANIAETVAEYSEETIVDIFSGPRSERVDVSVTETTEENKLYQPPVFSAVDGIGEPTSECIEESELAEPVPEYTEESEITTCNVDIFSEPLSESVDLFVTDTTHVNTHYPPSVHVSSTVDAEPIAEQTTECVDVSVTTDIDTISKPLSEYADVFVTNIVDEIKQYQPSVSTTVDVDNIAEPDTECESEFVITGVDIISDILLTETNGENYLSQSYVHDFDDVDTILEEITECIVLTAIEASAEDKLFLAPVSATDGADKNCEQFSDTVDVPIAEKTDVNKPSKSPVCASDDLDTTSDIQLESKGLSVIETTDVIHLQPSAPTTDNVDIISEQLAEDAVRSVIVKTDENYLPVFQPRLHVSDATDNIPEPFAEYVDLSVISNVENVSKPVIDTINADLVLNEIENTDKAEYSDDIFENSELSTDNSSVTDLDLCLDHSETWDNDEVYCTLSVPDKLSAYEQLLKDCSSPDDISKSSNTEFDVSSISDSHHLPDFNTALKQLESDFGDTLVTDTTDSSGNIQSKCLPEIDIVAADHIAIVKEVHADYNCVRGNNINIPNEEEALSEYDNVGDIANLVELDNEINDEKTTDSKYIYTSTLEAKRDQTDQSDGQATECTDPVEDTYLSCSTYDHAVEDCKAVETVVEPVIHQSEAAIVKNIDAVAKNNPGALESEAEADNIYTVNNVKILISPISDVSCSSGSIHDGIGLISKQLDVYEEIDNANNYIPPDPTNTDDKFRYSVDETRENEIYNNLETIGNGVCEYPDRTNLEYTNIDDTLTPISSNIIKNSLEDEDTSDISECKTEKIDTVKDDSVHLYPVYVKPDNDHDDETCGEDKVQSFFEVSQSPDEDSELEKSIKDVINKFRLDSPKFFSGETSSCTTPDTIYTSEPEEVNAIETDLDTDILGTGTTENISSVVGVQDFSNNVVTRREEPLTLEEKKRLSLIFELDESDESTGDLNTSSAVESYIKSEELDTIENDDSSKNEYTDNIPEADTFCKELKVITNDISSFIDKQDKSAIVEEITNIEEANESHIPVTLDLPYATEDKLPEIETAVSKDKIPVHDASKDTVESSNKIQQKLVQEHLRIIEPDTIEDKRKIIVNKLDVQYSEADDLNDGLIINDEISKDFDDDVFYENTEATRDTVSCKNKIDEFEYLEYNKSYKLSLNELDLQQKQSYDDDTSKIGETQTSQLEKYIEKDSSIGQNTAAVVHGRIDKESSSSYYQPHISTDHPGSADPSLSSVNSHVNDWISIESFSDGSVYSYDHNSEDAASMQMKRELCKRLEKISRERHDANDIEHSRDINTEDAKELNIIEQRSDKNVINDKKAKPSEGKTICSQQHESHEKTEETCENLIERELDVYDVDSNVDARECNVYSTETEIEQGMQHHVSPKHVKGIDKVKEISEPPNADKLTKNLDRVQQLKREASASSRRKFILQKQRSIEYESDSDRQCNETDVQHSVPNKGGTHADHSRTKQEKYHTYENVPENLKKQDQEKNSHDKNYHGYENVKHYTKHKMTGENIDKQQQRDVLEKIKDVDGKWQKRDNYEIHDGKVEYAIKQEKQDKCLQHKNSDKALYKKMMDVQETEYIVYPATHSMSNKEAEEAIVDKYSNDPRKMRDHCNTSNESRESHAADSHKYNTDNYHRDTSEESTEEYNKDTKYRRENYNRDSSKDSRESRESRDKDHRITSKENKHFGYEYNDRYHRENYYRDVRNESIEKDSRRYRTDNYRRSASEESRGSDHMHGSGNIHHRIDHKELRKDDRGNEYSVTNIDRSRDEGITDKHRSSSTEFRGRDRQTTDTRRSSSTEFRARDRQTTDSRRSNSTEFRGRDRQFTDSQRNSSTELHGRDRGISERHHGDSTAFHGNVMKTGARQKDGPLSLTDTYGAGMDGDAHNQSGSRVLSASSNNLSESTTSLSNRGYPATTGTATGVVTPQKHGTPHKHNTLQRDSSIQSESNGTVNHEPGIKFERLKNLEEDDLLSKIRDIMGHMERLEDYHRGDGMRIQKMLGDMYWDYTPLRETIGDTMALGGYAPVSMKMLKALNSIGIFKNDDVWFPTYYTYNTMWNFTDSSPKLAQALAENDAVRLLTLNCGHKPYIKAIYSKNVYYVMKASLSILHNIARNHGMKHLFDENKTSETIMPFLKSEDEMLCILATLTIANIVDEEENKTLITDTGTVKSIVTWIEKALNLPRRRYKGFTPQELTEGLNKLAVNDSNKMRILDEGALPLFSKMLLHDDVREQTSAARVIWTLAFDKEVRQKIKDFPDIVATLKKCTDSTNKLLQINASGALWVIDGENDVTRESRPKSAKTKSHVFLSYSWADKETVLAIRDRLRAEGYAIWIDVEKICGSTLDAMASAVESSAVVLMFMSEKYKSSPNCRTEAEYTFQLRKDYIPIMMQRKYRPDGWLGIIMGAKLYFDFSGKYPFEKSFQGLLKELRGRGKVTPGHTPADDQPDTAIIDKSSSLSSSLGTPVNQGAHNSPNSAAILRMGQEELVKWLRNIKLTECIPTFLEFDGKLLMQLKVMRVEAPEFFYQCLEKKLNMSLIEILKFTRALEELQ